MVTQFQRKMFWFRSAVTDQCRGVREKENLQLEELLGRL